MVRVDFMGNAGVSTHSRPKAAVKMERQAEVVEVVSTHSRPKAAVREITGKRFDG